VQRDRDLVEHRLAGAYKDLFDAPVDVGGAKTGSLARFGKYEVRLIRLARARPTDAPPIWLELYNHATQSGIDSCCCHDRAEAVHTAEAFVSRARKLDDESRKSQWFADD
jgi:hypothetical protein